MNLIICDIDGVLLDHRHRKHLEPPPELAGSNVNWIKHQSAINDAPDPVLAVNVMKVHEQLQNAHAMIFLTSRMTLAIEGTMRDLKGLGFKHHKLAGAIFRLDTDSTPAPQFKANGVKDILYSLLKMGHQVLHVTFIDDCQQNINAVMAMLEQGEYPIDRDNFRIFRVDGNGIWTLICL